MKLVSFTVEKYRSITKAHKIGISRLAILVGPNNEGKSNILRALVTAMNILTRDAKYASGKYRIKSRVQRHYNWERDFPIHLQSKNPKGESIMLLEFELSGEEIREFQEVIKSTLSGTLPLRIAIGREGAKITFHKKGRWAKTLSSKSEKIAQYVADRLDFEYIPAVRTAKSAQNIVEELVERELQILEDDPTYIKALSKIAEIQTPILNRLSNNIKDTLVKFLPAVNDVCVQIQSEARYRALRSSCEIIIDDGTPTLLQFKGDGVQSLAALGIMRHASDKGALNRNLVIAIEEPESHLHPKAIHELRDVINELSRKHQIVVTTHCPLFVDRTKTANNIIVNKNKAQPAKSIHEIRDILGVKASDNMRHAELMLLVEGESDKTALESLLSHYSPVIKAALENGTIAIDTLSGGSNLAYKASLVQDALCQAHCFLDDDKAGRDSFERARIEGYLTEADVNFSVCGGMKDAEIEDLYDSTIYKDVIKNRYRVDLTSPKFKTAKKWTDRIHSVFKQQGKPWDERIERELKASIAQVIAARPDLALNSSKRSSFDGLIKNLTERLVELR